MNLARLRTALPTLLTLAVIAPAALVGCTALNGTTFAAIFPAIINGIEEAAIVISRIEGFVQKYQADAALKAKLETALADAKAALDAVSRAAALAKDIADKDLQKAISDFTAAFTALTELAAQIGVQVNGAPAKVGAPAVKLQVPRPIILDLKRSVP